eukprot:2004972-Pleurochrysis_carterae.AAC.1
MQIVTFTGKPFAIKRTTRAQREFPYFLNRHYWAADPWIGAGSEGDKQVHAPPAKITNSSAEHRRGNSSL